MANKNIFSCQLKNAQTLESIITAGGTVLVTGNNTRAKLSLFDAVNTGTTKTNSFAPVRGMIEFAVADTVLSVDMYIMAPGGQFVVAKNIKPSGPNEIFVDMSVDQCMVIPFDHADFAATVETATGFTVPSKGALKPTPWIDVIEIDATETIDVGTATADSGDPDGLLDGISVATAGLVKGTLLNSGATLGALLFVQDSANAGDDAPEISVASAGKGIVITTSAGSDTVSGLLYQPYLIGQ